MLSRRRWTIGVTLAIAALSVASAHAQDPGSTVEIEGIVVSFVAAPGASMPTLVVDDYVLDEVDIRLAPYRVLRDLGFAATPGQDVRVTALPCEYCEADYAAIVVFNLTTGMSFTLRDEDGHPVWTRDGTLVVDDSAATLSAAESDLLEATGTVVAFVGGTGSGTPTLTLEVDGIPTDFRVSPYHAWTTAGWTPDEGQSLTVTYVDVHVADETIHLAISVYDPVTGMTLYLRDPETGRPASAYRFGGGSASEDDVQDMSARQRQRMLQRRR